MHEIQYAVFPRSTYKSKSCFSPGYQFYVIENNLLTNGHVLATLWLYFPITIFICIIHYLVYLTSNFNLCQITTLSRLFSSDTSRPALMIQSSHVFYLTQCRKSTLTHSFQDDKRSDLYKCKTRQGNIWD